MGMLSMGGVERVSESAQMSILALLSQDDKTHAVDAKSCVACLQWSTIIIGKLSIRAPIF
jgi:hypothetical protein